MVKEWKAALARIGLSDPSYVQYQLRHGGPSHDIRFHHRSLLSVKTRGRWVSDKNLRRYEAHARLQKEVSKLSPAFLDSSEKDVLELPSVLRKVIDLRGSWTSSPGPAACRKPRRARAGKL